MSFLGQTKLRSMSRRHEAALMEAFETHRSGQKLTRLDLALLKPNQTAAMGAMNRASRVLWGKALCQMLSERFRYCEKSETHVGNVYLVTLADIRCATQVSSTDISMALIKRRLRLGLRGVSYIGMIEPAFYVNLQAGVRFTGKRCLYWHIHALVWGVKPKEIKELVHKMNSGQYLGIAAGLNGAHRKKVRQGDLPRVVGYILKPPMNGYRVSRHDIEQDGMPLIDEFGEIQAKFIQGKAKLRPGQRVELFHVMKNMRLDELCIAGGQGVPMLARAKRCLSKNR
jgi:hypothetical protein